MSNIRNFFDGRSFTIRTVDPVIGGSLDVGGLLGVSVKNVTTDAPLTVNAVEFSQAGGIKENIEAVENTVRIDVDEMTNVTDEYLVTYDDAVGDWRLVTALTKTELVTHPDFGFACGDGWSCVASADAVTGILPSNSAYFKETIPAVNVISGDLLVNVKVAATSLGGGLAYIGGSNLGGVNIGEEKTFHYHSVPSGFNFDIFPSASGATGCEWEHYSVKDQVITTGDKVPSFTHKTASSKLSTALAHINHWKMDERSGTVLVDSISGMNITEVIGGHLSYVDPYSISCTNAGDAVSFNKSNAGLQGYGSGLMLYYGVTEFKALSGTYGNTRKASYSHLDAGINNVFDIQKNVDGSNVLKCTISSTENNIGGLDLLDANNPLVQFASGDDARFSVAFFVYLNETPVTGQVFFSDGVTVLKQAVTTFVNRIDLDIEQPSFEFDPLPNPRELASTMRASEQYLKGLYCFQEFRPTEIEIEDFVKAIYTSATTGGKEVYAPWVGKV